MRRSRNSIVYNPALECNRFFWYILVCVPISFSGLVCWPLRFTRAYSYGSRVDHHHLLRDSSALGHMGDVEVAWTSCTSSLRYSCSPSRSPYGWRITTECWHGHSSSGHPDIHDARHRVGHVQFVAGGSCACEHGAGCPVLAHGVAMPRVHICRVLAKVDFSVKLS